MKIITIAFVIIGILYAHKNNEFYKLGENTRKIKKKTV